MGQRKIRVLVVDDSDLFREALVPVLESDPAIRVVGQARHGHEAIALDELLAPDVITMDVIMPGLDASREILARRDVAIILLTTPARTDEQRMALNTLRLGVLDVANKPN